MRNLILLFIILFGFSTKLSAQAIDTLPVQHEAFVEGLAKLFSSTNRSELKDLTKEFETEVKQGNISSNVMDGLISTVNRMIVMRGKPYPQIQSIVKSYLALNKVPLNSAEWDDLHATLFAFMDKSQKGDTKSTLEFLEFCIPLYEQNALYFSKAKTWSMSSEQFELSYGSDGPIVQFKDGDIKGATSGDSLQIFKTAGVYHYNTNIWKGEKGHVTWERAGLPSNEVFADFGAYEIDMSTQSYTVDEVTFTYKNYFENTVTGSFEDKIVAQANVETTRFPRFVAEKDNVPPQAITENILYFGGFTLAGSKVSGSAADEESELIIYEPSTRERVLKAVTNSITINLPERISSTNAEVSLYFDADSIYHPSINLFYDITDNTVKLVKGEGSLSESNFYDSYHNIEFNVDVLLWNLAEQRIDMNTISTSGIKAAKFESVDYFSKQKMQQLRGNVSYDPLSLLRGYTEKNMQDYIYASEFAKMISPNLGVGQIKPLLFNLISEGFIDYDEETEMITVKPKVSHYVLSNAKKKDFDNISIISNNKQNNASIYLADKTVHLTGVRSVPISLANSTIFLPDSQQIVVEKNRDMLFDGLFFSGRLDFFGKNNHFNYSEFNMDLPEIDTLIINIPDGDKLDEYGNPKLRPINSTLENLQGTLDINLPINKSNSSELPQYPIFESTSKAKIFYDSKKTRGGTYTRDKFYYEIDPFSIDSLMFIDKYNLKFDGQLYSAGIFPNLNEPVVLQEDLSLGFHVVSPPEGFDVYQGKGKFISEISLDNTGLTGTGVIQYLTTSFESSNIQFYPDSMIAITDTFGVEESKGSYESPWVKSANNLVEWYPYKDSMVAYSDDVTPFNMFDDRIEMEGMLEITDKGIYGSGVADWEDAQLVSNRFKFNSEELLADTAELKIKTIDGDKVTFVTPNVNAYVDFRENTGFFKSNTNENRTEFNYNQYATTIDEFFWDIDNKNLEFSVPEGSPGAPFVSLNLSQDTLSFIAKKADYSLETSIIEASGVSEIFVADSRVIPHEGIVRIYPEAKMETLEKATIEASAESKRHIMEDVTITINGKYDIKATGKYKYTAKNTPEQFINLPKIEVILADSSQIDKKKGKIEQIIHAKGLVLKDENFIIYPDVLYYGDMDVYSSLDYVKIKGFTKVDFKSPYVITDFFQVDGKVDPDSLDLTVEGAKDPQNKVIRTGIFVNKAGIEPLYTNILNNQIGPLDVPLIEANGILRHYSDKNLYVFGDEEKISSKDITKGNILRFTPNDHNINAQGSLDLGLAYGALNEKVSGDVYTNLEKKEYTFNTSIAFPIEFDNTILERMGYYLFEDNFDMDDINYDNEDLLYQWVELTSEKTFKKVQEEIQTKAYFEKPKDVKASIILTDVDLKYYPQERVYRSEGKFGLAFVGDKAVHKMINGYVEMGHRLGSDYLNLYFKTSYNDYVYITYTTNLLEVASSFNDITDAINAINVEKRRIKGENNVSYVYAATNEMKAKSFIQRMKILEDGGTLPPPEPPKVKPKEDTDNPTLDTGSNPPKDEKDKNIKEDNPTLDTGNSGEEENSNNSGVPQEVLDFENNSKKKKKKD